MSRNVSLEEWADALAYEQGSGAGWIELVGCCDPSCDPMSVIHLTLHYRNGESETLMDASVEGVHTVE